MLSAAKVTYFQKSSDVCAPELKQINQRISRSLQKVLIAVSVEVSVANVLIYVT